MPRSSRRSRICVRAGAGFVLFCCVAFPEFFLAGLAASSRGAERLAVCTEIYEGALCQPKERRREGGEVKRGRRTSLTLPRTERGIESTYCGLRDALRSSSTMRLK